MSIFGPASTPLNPGLNQAGRVAARKSETKKASRPDGPKRGSDEVEIDVQTAQSVDAVRNLKANAEEETEDDRQEQDHYRPQKEQGEERPRLDVQG